MALILFLGASTIGSIPLIILVVVTIVTRGVEGSLPDNMFDMSYLGIPANLGYLLLLLGFVAMFFAFKWLIQPLHKRSLTETINGRSHLRRDRIGMGMLVWGALMMITLVTGLLISPENYQFQFHLGQFLVLLLITLVVLPFQTSFEEIFFRGYLAQGIAAATRSRWWTLIIISLAFGLMHAANPEVKAFGFWISMPQYLLMGLILGVVTILDDGIELALGIHFVNNAFFAVFTTHSSSALQTDALFKVKEINPQMELAWMMIYALIVITLLGRIYRWDFSILHRKVAIETPPLPFGTPDRE